MRTKGNGTNALPVQLHLCQVRRIIVPLPYERLKLRGINNMTVMTIPKQTIL